jgi:hypothetical protein
MKVSELLDIIQAYPDAEVFVPLHEYSSFVPCAGLEIQPVYEYTDWRGDRVRRSQCQVNGKLEDRNDIVDTGSRIVVLYCD